MPPAFRDKEEEHSTFIAALTPRAGLGPQPVSRPWCEKRRIGGHNIPAAKSRGDQSQMILWVCTAHRCTVTIHPTNLNHLFRDVIIEGSKVNPLIPSSTKSGAQPQRLDTNTGKPVIAHSLVYHKSPLLSRAGVDESLSQPHNKRGVRHIA